MRGPQTEEEDEVPDMVSTGEIREMGESVREASGIEDGTDSFSTCREVATDLEQELSTRGVEAWVMEAHMGDARETHYCLYVSGEFIEDMYGSNGGVVIDPTMDQFCTENAEAGRTEVNFGPCESLPSVAIHRPEAEERTVSYFQPKTPRGIYNQFPFGGR